MQITIKHTVTYDSVDDYYKDAKSFLETGYDIENVDIELRHGLLCTLGLRKKKAVVVTYTKSMDIGEWSDD